MRLSVCRLWAAFAASVLSFYQAKTPALFAQTSAGPCLADSAAANSHLWSLERFVREANDSLATVVWSRDPAVCRAANQVVQQGVPDSLRTNAPGVFVYTVQSQSALELRYIVVWAERNPRCEWQLSCWYDRQWQRVGNCIAF
jgi:hypothetical protein